MFTILNAEKDVMFKLTQQRRSSSNWLNHKDNSSLYKTKCDNESDNFPLYDSAELCPQ